MQGNAKSQNWLGLIYYRAGESQRAIPWFKMAVEQNNSVAPYNLALLYTAGGDVDVDLVKSLEYAAIAAEHERAYLDFYVKTLF